MITSITINKETKEVTIIYVEDNVKKVFKSSSADMIAGVDAIIAAFNAEK